MWTLNGQPAPRDPASGWIMDEAGVKYPPGWAAEELEAVGLIWVEPEPAASTLDQLCAAIDAERDRRMALDFAHNFGATLARDDAGAEIEAGVRQLQMRPEDRANWQTLQGAALTAVVNSQPSAILPMRAEDNWNIQTTALQVLGVLAEMTAHGSALLFAGGALKSQQRAIYPEVVDITTGWPT